MGFIQQFPRSFGSQDLTYINIEAFKLEKQNLNPRSATYINKGASLFDWAFIGFTDLQESISHTWEPYGSIQGRMNQLISDTKANIGKVSDVFNDIGSTSDAGLTNRLNAGTTEAARYKVDTPLVYTSSARRQISFTFTLMEWRDAYSDVLQPIHEFRRLSCASIADATIDRIEWPAVFTIESDPQAFISIKDAALTDVQVTWNSHHKSGNPTRAELTVTFLDLRPLYKSSWGEADGVITTQLINELDDVYGEFGTF